MGSIIEYSLVVDFNNGINIDKIRKEIQMSAIGGLEYYINVRGDRVTFFFDIVLNASQESVLDGIVSAHDATTPINCPAETVSGNLEVSENANIVGDLIVGGVNIPTQLNQHIADLDIHADHSTIHIIGTEGISGNGNILSNVTLSLGINELEQDMNPASSDFLVTYDVSEMTHKRVLLNDISGGGGGIISGNIAAVQVSISSDLSTTVQNVFTDIDFDSTDVENESSILEHDITNIERLNIGESGEYLISYAAVFEDATTETLTLRVRRNDTLTLDSSVSSASTSGDSNSHNISNTFVATLVDGDFITLQYEFTGTSGASLIRSGANFGAVRLKSLKGDAGPQGNNTVIIQDTNANISSEPFTTLNFLGDGVIASDGSGGIADITVNANIIGSGATSDLEIAVFNTTSGTVIQGAGVRDYGVSTTDPTTPTPANGDKYYNSAINHEMRYDASRGKWLSTTTFMDGAGRNGSTAANGFYRRWNGMILANTLGPVVPKGTIVYIGYSTSNAVAHTYEVLVDGVVISTLASGGSSSASSNTFNDDFDAGILSSRNASGGSSTSNFQSVIYYKLRA